MICLLDQVALAKMIYIVAAESDRLYYSWKIGWNSWLEL